MLVALPLPIALCRTLVVLELSLGKRDFELDPALRVVHVQGNERVPALLDFAYQFAGLFSMEQELSASRGVRREMRRYRGEGADMGSDEPQCAILDDDIGLAQLRARGANGFNFPAFQNNAGFKAVLDKIVVERLPVLYDGHRFGEMCILSAGPLS